MKVVIENGLRKIPPYYYTNKIYSKERWFRRTVLDVITTEFKAHVSSEHNDIVSIVKAKTGIVHRDKDALRTIIENGDILEYRNHFHEPAIIDFGPVIEIIDDSENLLVVNKPSGVPTHPSGKYRLNSLTEILAKQTGYPVYPTHRLDRLTSGIVILGKTSQATARFRKDFTANDTLCKEYYAKVVGKFPSETTFEFPLFDIDGNRDLKNFLNAFGTRKVAQTKFKLISYNPDDNFSIVSCVPITGRTHQIRKHLAIMGHPIVNDTLYKRPVFRELSLLLEKLSDDGDNGGLSSELKEAFGRLQLATKQSRLDKLETEENASICPECNVHLFRDAISEEMIIYLHARRYTCEVNGGVKWNYEAPLPKWV